MVVVIDAVAMLYDVVVDVVAVDDDCDCDCVVMFVVVV